MDFDIIETAWGDSDVRVYIDRSKSDKFKAAVKALGDFMESLNLPTEKHNRLIELTLSQIEAAENNACEQAFMLGFQCGRNEISDTNE